jgi:DNA-binding SARP family transcriptional activator
MMQFRILGSLEVAKDGRPIALGGTRQRAVLAILLLHRREVVSVDRLVDELWGERSPGTATKTVQVYVSRLRKELGEGVLLTRGGGYMLDIEPEQLDAARFERLAQEGRHALERGSTCGAVPLWATSPTRSSRRARSRASTSFGRQRSRSASRPTWRLAATPL